MDLSFVVIDRQIVDRRFDRCFILVHLTVSSFQSSFSSHTVPPWALEPPFPCILWSWNILIINSSGPMWNLTFFKKWSWNILLPILQGPGTSFFQFFRALEPPSPYTVVLGHISNYSSGPGNLLLIIQWSWDILLIILKGIGTSLYV